jgi:hypothetical protein
MNMPCTTIFHSLLEYLSSQMSFNLKAIVNIGIKHRDEWSMHQMSCEL